MKLISTLDPLSLYDKNFYIGKSILITGASGVVGFNLAYNLLTLYGESISIDLIGRTSLTSCQSEFLAFSNANYIKLDLSKSDSISKLSHNFYDIVFHSATYAQPLKYQEENLSTIILNTSATHSLASLVKKGGSFCFLSSTDIYYGNNKLPYKETDIGSFDPWQPRGCYFESKRMGETICSVMAKLDINVKVIRLALGYGVGFKIDDKRVLYKFIRDAITKQEINMMDDGRAPRTYIYISDVVKMILNAVSSGKHNVYNVGSNERTTIRNIAELISKNLGTNLNIPDSTELYLKDAPHDVWVDITRYKKEFNDPISVNLEDGISRCIDWTKYLLSNKT